jgi:hypothetical protein
VGSLALDGRVADGELLLELEHAPSHAADADPLLFTAAMNTLLPRLRGGRWAEANSSFSPCADHDPADLRAAATLADLKGDGDVGLLLADAEPAAGLQGVRVTAALLGAARMYGLGPRYEPRHAALQFAQVALHARGGR